MLVAAHVLIALCGLGLGWAALRFPNGTPRHRAIGKGYLLAWLGIALTGFALGADTPDLSAFEVLTAIGLGCVLLAYTAIRLRRRLGAKALRWHYVWMTVSLAALGVTAANQIVLQAWGPYPRWVFWGLVLSPFAFLPPFHRVLDGRYLGASTERPRASRANGG